MITNIRSSIYDNDLNDYGFDQEEQRDDYSTEDDDEEADFFREMNRTKASYMAFSHVLSEQYVLLKDYHSGYENGIGNYDVTEEMILDMIELKAKLCRDAVASALKMEDRRRKIREEMELRLKSTMKITTHLSKGAADYQKRQDTKRMHSVMLKGGLLGFTPVVKSHLPQEVAAYQQRKQTKQMQSVMIKGGLLGVPQLIKGLTSAKITMKRITMKRISSITRVVF